MSTKVSAARRLFVSSDEEEEAPISTAPKSSRSTKKKDRRHRTYKNYLRKILKQLDRDVMLTADSVHVLDSFVRDMCERLAVEASCLCEYSKRRTIGMREVETAVRLLLPGELRTHAINQGRKAVQHLNDAKQK